MVSYSIYMETVKTVLLVDDTPDLLETLRRLLEANAYRVLCARDGREALEQLKSHAQQIDLLVTDLVLPGMDGVDVAAWGVRLCPEMKVLFISGVGERPDTPLPEGSVLLQKPFSGKALLQKAGELTG